MCVHVCVSDRLNETHWTGRTGLLCRSTRCSVVLWLLQLYVCAWKTRLLGDTVCCLKHIRHERCESAEVALLFLAAQRFKKAKCIWCCIYFSFLTACAASFPTIHWLWFMNSMTWPRPLGKWEQMRVFRGKMSCRRVIVTAQPSRVVALPWQLCCSVFSRKFWAREGTLCSAAQYLMKNLSEVAIRVCCIR